MFPILEVKDGILMVGPGTSGPTIKMPGTTGYLGELKIEEFA